MKITKKPRLIKMGRLKDKADNVFSKWIRKRDKNTCYTCGKVISEEKQQEGDSQCGHYEPRTHTSTRYNEKNCHCQDRYCNVFMDGNKTVYALNLVRQYGVDILEELHREKHKTVKCDRLFLEGIIKKYS